MQNKIVSSKSHKESHKTVPREKPYLFNPKLKFRSERKEIFKLLKAQKKQLLNMTFFFQTYSEPYNKMLVQLCDKYPRNLHWLKCLSFQEGYSTKLAIKNILRIRKCLQTAQSLTSLEISGSTLNQVRTLAPVLRGLKKLEVLSLDLRNFTGNPFGNKFFSSVKALKGLREIRFDVQPREKLPPGTFEKLNAGLSRLKTLNSISFDFSGLHLSDKQELFFDFRVLKSLSALALILSRVEGLDDKFVGNIAQSLKQVPKLEKLGINLYYSPQIANKGVEVLSSSLPLDLKSLKINLGSCEQVKEEGIQSLFCSIGKMTSLEDLSLWISSRNHMTNEGLLDLNLCLSGLKRLKSFEMSFMNMSGDIEIHDLAFDEFLCALASKTALKNLVLHFPSSGTHMIDDKRLEKFGNALVSLERIEKLELIFRWHSFDDAALELFSEKLKSFEKLKTLSLDFSHSWRDHKAKMLERFIKNLEKMKDLRKATLNFEYCHSLDMEEVDKILPNPKSLNFELSVLYENTMYLS